MGSRTESGKSKSFSCTWDSLRNSAGEKILQLRSHPLGIPTDSNFCSLLSDLSLEQRFDVSYLDLGKSRGSCGLTAHSGGRKIIALASCFRRAQSERPVSVSRGVVHPANHSLPRVRDKYRCRQSQRSPQCTAVPQDHGWRKVMLST